MFSDTRAHKGTLYAMYNIFMWALKYAASFISYDNMYMYIQYLTCQIIHKQFCFLSFTHISFLSTNNKGVKYENFNLHKTKFLKYTRLTTFFCFFEQDPWSTYVNIELYKTIDIYRDIIFIAVIITVLSKRVSLLQ